MSTEFFYNDIDLSGNTLSNSTLKNISMEKVSELPAEVSEDGRIVVFNDQLYQYKKQTTVAIADIKPANDPLYIPNPHEIGRNGHGTVAVIDGVPTVYNLVPSGEDYPTNITFSTTLQTNDSNDFDNGSSASPGTWMVTTDGRLFYRLDETTTIIYNPAWEIGGEWQPISADQDLIADLEQKIDSVSLGIKNKASVRYRAHSTGIDVSSSISKTEMIETLHAYDTGGKLFKLILQENGHDLMSYLGEHSTASRSFDKSQENTLMFQSLGNRVIGIEDVEILSTRSGAYFRGMVLNSREDYLLFKRLVTGIIMNFKTGGPDMAISVNDVLIAGGIGPSEGPIVPVFVSNSTLSFDPFENKQVTLSFQLKTEATAEEAALINSYIQDEHYASADVEWVALNEKMTEDVDIKDQRILFSDGVYTVIETDPTSGSYKLERSQDMLAGTDATGLFVFVEQGLPDISEDMGFLQTQDDVTIAGTEQVIFERFTGVSTQTKKTVRELKQYVSEAMGATELTRYTMPMSNQFLSTEQYETYLDQQVKGPLIQYQNDAPYVSMFETPQLMGGASEFPDSELEELWGGSLGDVYRSKKNPAMFVSPMFGLDAIPAGQSWNDLSNIHKLFFYVFNLVLQEVRPRESYPIKFAIYSLDEIGNLVRNPDMERYAKVETGYNGFTAGKIAEVKELFEQVALDDTTTWRGRTFSSTNYASNWIAVLRSYEAMLKIYESRLYTLHIPVKSKRVSLDKYLVAVDEVLIDPMYASPYLKNLDGSSQVTNFVPEAFNHVEQFVSPTTKLSIGDQEKLILNRSVYGIPSTPNDSATKFFFGNT